MRRSFGSPTQKGPASLSHAELVTKARQQAAETAHWQLQISPRSPVRQLAPELSVCDDLGSPGRRSVSHAYGSASRFSSSPTRRSAPVMSARSPTSPSGRSPRNDAFVPSPRNSPEKSVFVEIQRRPHADEQLNETSRQLFSPQASLNESAWRRADETLVPAGFAGSPRADATKQRSFGYSSSNTTYEQTLLHGAEPTTSMGLSPTAGASRSDIKRFSEDSDLPVVPKISSGEFPLLEVSREHAVEVAVEHANKKVKELDMSQSPANRQTAFSGGEYMLHHQIKGLEESSPDRSWKEPQDSPQRRIASLEQELMKARAEIRSLSAEVFHLKEEKALAEFHMHSRDRWIPGQVACIR